MIRHAHVDVDIDDPQFGKRKAPPVSPMVGKAVELRGFGDYAGQEMGGTIHRVSRDRVVVAHVSYDGSEEVKTEFDAVTGWPFGDRVNGFRLTNKSLAPLIDERKLTTTHHNGESKTMSTETQERPTAQSVVLEGYGQKKGENLKAEVVKKDADVIVIEVTDGNGNKSQQKFRTADGLLASAKPGGSGFRIPAAALASLTGKAANVKKASAPRVSKPKAPPIVASLFPTNETGKCLCGCGATVKKGTRFYMGHDAKFKSMVLRGLRGQLDKKDAPPNVAQQVEHDGGFGSQAPAPKEKSEPKEKVPAAA